MGKKRYTMEQITAKLRAAEIELAKGQKTPDVCRKLGISKQPIIAILKEANSGNF